MTVYYSDKAAVVATLTGITPPPSVGEIPDWWQVGIDRMIEKHAGSQGYKGASRTFRATGGGTRILRLPSRYVEIENITENGQDVSTASLDLQPGTRNVERAFTTWPYYGPGCWVDGARYVVQYLEPDIDALPDEWVFAANECLKRCFLFGRKEKLFGLALSSSESGMAGKVSSGDATTFPASLVLEMQKVIAALVRKPAF